MLTIGLRCLCYGCVEYNEMLIETYINSFVNFVDFFKGVDTDRPSVYIEDCIARQDPLVEVFLIFYTFMTNVAFFKLKLYKNGCCWVL